MKDEPLSIHHRPIILPKATMDHLLRLEKPSMPIALYMFYYYTAIWQKTNQPKCTTDYSAKGLKTSVVTIRKAKKQLMKIGLIEDVVEKQDTKITGHYIHVMFYEGESHTYENPEDGKSKKATPTKTQRVEKIEGNAYSTNKRNAYSTHRRPTLTGVERQISTSNSFYMKCAQYLHKHLAQKNKIMRRPLITKWSKTFWEFITKNNIEHQEFKRILRWYCKNIGLDFIPSAYSASSFCAKYVQIKDAQERENKTKDGDIKTNYTYSPLFSDTEKMIKNPEGFTIGIAAYDSATGKLRGTHFYDEKTSTKVPKNLKGWK